MGSSNSHSNMEYAEEPKFADNYEELVKPIFDKGRYKNPFDTFEERNFSDVFRMIKEKDHSQIPWNDKEVFFIFSLNRTDYDIDLVLISMLRVFLNFN